MSQAITATAATEPAYLGYFGLGVVVAVQSMGVPLPAETALIAGAVLAAQGGLEIVPVITAAVVGAILGGAAGYAIGRKGGRWLLERPGIGENRRRAFLERGEVFFSRHGSRAVLFARWISGVRIVTAPLAGVHHMRFPIFMFWNVVGGLLWPASIGLIAFWLGKQIAVLVGVMLLAVLVLAVIARRRGARV